MRDGGLAKSIIDAASRARRRRSIRALASPSTSSCAGAGTSALPVASATTQPTMALSALSFDPGRAPSWASVTSSSFVWVSSISRGSAAMMLAFTAGAGAPSPSGTLQAAFVHALPSPAPGPARGSLSSVPAALVPAALVVAAPTASLPATALAAALACIRMRSEALSRTPTLVGRGGGWEFRGGSSGRWLLALPPAFSAAQDGPSSTLHERVVACCLRGEHGFGGGDA